MSMNGKPDLVLVLSLLLAPQLSAQLSPAGDPLHLDKNVVGVVSAGDWSSGAAHGSVRIVALRQGVAGMGNRIIVEWLEGSGEERDVRVRQWIDLRSVAPDWARAFVMPTVTTKAGTTILTIWAAAERGAATNRLLFEIGAPGIVRRRSPLRSD
jgi:hypothetical protein